MTQHVTLRLPVTRHTEGHFSPSWAWETKYSPPQFSDDLRCVWPGLARWHCGMGTLQNRVPFTVTLTLALPDLPRAL
ncbi:hypothetical protein NDU88_006788 [Pleurodeles waltl]|uniref:Uncharacterized protein n=1 Tax=Pleurodeles waltl TaxID=8319 RepID=A0AAV7WBK5_PLEWA|nr:hypothetical protein NDU88_006788 [Pleurodeles waltl]